MYTNNERFDSDNHFDQLIDALAEMPEPGDVVGDPERWPNWTDEACWECGVDPLPETDDQVSQISEILALRSEGKISMPLTDAETLLELRDRKVLHRYIAKWFTPPPVQPARRMVWNEWLLSRKDPD